MNLVVGEARGDTRCWSLFPCARGAWSGCFVHGADCNQSNPSTGPWGSLGEAVLSDKVNLGCTGQITLKPAITVNNWTLYIFSSMVVPLWKKSEVLKAQPHRQMNQRAPRQSVGCGGGGHRGGGLGNNVK